MKHLPTYLLLIAAMQLFLGCSSTRNESIANADRIEIGEAATSVEVVSDRSSESVTDWGVVTLRPGEPADLKLRSGRQCNVTAAQLDQGVVALSLTTGMNDDGKRVMAMTLVPGNEIMCNIDGELVRFTPILAAR